MVKKTPTKAGDVRDMGLIPGLGDSLQDAQQPLQYSCLDRGAWQAMVHMIPKS